MQWLAFWLRGDKYVATSQLRHSAGITRIIEVGAPDFPRKSRTDRDISIADETML